MTESYQESKDRNLVTDDPGFTVEASEMIFKAGQSKRIWNEVYKVEAEHFLLIYNIYCLLFVVLNFVCQSVSVIRHFMSPQRSFFRDCLRTWPNIVFTENEQCTVVVSWSSGGGGGGSGSGGGSSSSLNNVVYRLSWL